MAEKSNLGLAVFVADLYHICVCGFGSDGAVALLSWARDYKEIWSMDWCSTHDFVLNKQKTQKWRL